ncbi:nucleotidyltransferase domain-containing protein [Candidatus Woesearchaeota archaeon]|nr:nucleotidyltransferase domain-containing protein [Candidatus Woesearchaeota archaeon]
MLNIINKGYLDILRLFYASKDSIHLREIAKKAKLNENSAYRFLTKLEKDKILKSEKEGNMKFFSLKNNKKTDSILTFFDIERYEKLPSIRRTAIETYLNHLPKQPIFAIIFGSTAKNTFRDDSDIDILIVTNERIKTNQAEDNAGAQSALKVSTFQITYKDFKREIKLKNDMVIQSAIASGFPLINHIKYYEDLQNAKI